ncbi:hypothetical protein U1Q18_052679 [Sarracenia purpurea var. burkii]
MTYIPLRPPLMLGMAFAYAHFLVMLFSLVLSLAIVGFLTGGRGSSSRTKSQSSKRSRTLHFDCFSINAVDETYAVLATYGVLIERNILISAFTQIRLATQFEQRGWLGFYTDHREILSEMVQKFYSNVTAVDTIVRSF